MGRELPILDNSNPGGQPAQAGAGKAVAGCGVAGAQSVAGLENVVLSAANPGAPTRRHPEWIRAKMPGGEGFRDMKRLMGGLTLHTVCEEARCPNIGECWDQRTATIMVLGDTCTRACGFCAVATGRPGTVDEDEPRRVAEALANLDLDHVVITCVARDDLPDGGAGIIAETVRQVRARKPAMGIEALISDLNGEDEPLRTIVASGLDICDHNVETVERLQKPVRKRARYDRSLGVLERAKAMAVEMGRQSSDRPMLTKSSIMVGLGETREELTQVFRDLRAVDCDILTIGQYLRPTLQQLPVERYWTPAEFAELREEALSYGFKHVESGPLVRTSYHARDQVPGGAARRAAAAASAAGASSAVTAAASAGAASEA